NVVRRYEVEGAGEQSGVCDEILLKGLSESIEDSLRALEISWFAGEHEQLNEIRHHDGIGIRSCIVLRRFHADNHIIRIVGGREVATSGIVPVMAIKDTSEMPGSLQVE